MCIKMLTIFLLALASSTGNIIAENESDTVHIRYLYNSGWLIETKEHILLIDYVPSKTINQDEQLIGDLIRAKTEGKEPYILITHEHNDHFYKPLLDWGKRVNGLQIILGWDFKIQEHNIHQITGRNRIRIGQVSIDAHPSTDAGSSFLIQLGPLEIYHAGDHALWSEDLRERFLSEINFIRSKSRTLTLAFIPVARGKLAGCKTDELMIHGALKTIELLKPKIVFPMHVGCGDFTPFEVFAKSARQKFEDVSIYAPVQFNEIFELKIN